jgi:lysophospholipase L1-like esterase
MVGPCSTATTHHIALLGDSIAHGAAPQLAAQRPNWRIVPVAVPGAAASAGSIQLNGDMTWPLLADMTVCTLGTNDWGLSAPLDVFRARYDAIITRATALKPGFVAVTPIWRADDGQLNSAGLLLEDYRAVIHQVAAAHGKPVIEGPLLVDHDAKYFADGVHPNAEGNRQLAARMARALDALLL